MKVMVNFTLDSELVQLLNQETNKSHVINELLKDYYEEFAGGLAKKVQDLKQKQKEIRQKMRKLKQKIEKEEAIKRESLEKRNELMEKWRKESKGKMLER